MLIMGTNQVIMIMIISNESTGHAMGTKMSSLATGHVTRFKGQ